MGAKTALTVEEVYKVAYLHHVMGIEQLALSVAFSVNAGRISEACTIMQHAAENLTQLRAERKRKRARINSEDHNERDPGQGDRTPL